MFYQTNFREASKKIIFLTVILFLFKNTDAQSKFGIMAGAGNTSLYKFPFEVADYNKYSSRTSYWAGITADLPINKKGISFYAAAAYAKKGYKYSLQNQSGANNTIKDSGYTQKLNYIDINLNLLKKFPMSDAVNFFAGTGPSANIFISGSEETSLTYFGNTAPPVKATQSNLAVGNTPGAYKRTYFSWGFAMGFELNNFNLWIDYHLPLTGYYQDANKAADHKLKSFGINASYTLFTLNKVKKEKREKEKKIKEPKVKEPKPVLIVKDTLTDTDGDGILDKDDKCPGHKGTAKYKGCPIPDTDGDGINDDNDRCPLVAGDASNNGCPAFSDSVRAVQKDTLHFTIYFEPAKSILRTDAYNVLAEVVKLLKGNPKLMVIFKGHTDNVGSVEANSIRSFERAMVCADYIASFYIDRSRIVTAAYGNTMPAADLNDPLLQWKNRRVEIYVFEKE